MKVQTITVGFKQGMPEYSSVNSAITVEVQEGDNLDEVWDWARQQAWNNCTPDPKWIREKTENHRKFEEEAGKASGKQGYLDFRSKTG